MKESEMLPVQPTGTCIGASFIGFNADKVINPFALSIADLQEMAWAYPTGGFDINRIP
jgi:hypothetical protein